MTHVKLRLGLLGVCAVTALASYSSPSSAAPADRSYVLLSDRIGRPQYIGLPLSGSERPEEPVTRLKARAMTGDEISRLFVQLCLTKLFDRSAYDEARTDAAKDFITTKIELETFGAPKPFLGSYTRPAAAFTQEQSEYGTSSLWLGEGSDSLQGRQYVLYSGSLVISGPVSLKDLYSPQCNLTLNISGLGSSKALLDGIERGAVGFSVVKRVEKPKYGYATWTKRNADGRIIRIEADSGYLLKQTQIVHVSMQMLPTGKDK